MRSVVNRHFANATDSFTFGLRPSRVALGATLTSGIGFPSINTGRVVLIRQPLYPTEGTPIIVGAALANTNPVNPKNFTSFPMVANQSYYLWTHHVAGNMVFDKESSKFRRVDFDGDGELISPGLPNRPYNIQARQADGGSVQITWQVFDIEGIPSPTGFQVFGNNPLTWEGALTDRDTDLDYVLYYGAGLYTFTTTAYPDDTEVFFGVRAYNSSGFEKNEYSTSIVVDASIPSQSGSILRADQYDGGGR